MAKTVAVAMIVKNEEALLARCLESVKGLPIYILDTGSQDSTVQIALQYTDNVYLDFIWTDDFSAAQNLIKSRVKEDFILSIDADEVLLTGIQSVIDAAQKAKDVARVKMIAEGTMLDFGFGRIFRNTPDIFWCQSIHKHLNIPGEGEEVGDVRIMYGWSPAHLRDPDRSLRMLEDTVSKEENPVRNLYYLGREYMYKQRYQDAIDTLGRYVKVSQWPAEQAEAYMEMGQAHEQFGRYQEAGDCYAQAIKINPNFKEAVLCMAKISSPENAKQWNRMAKYANNHDVLWKRSEVESNRNMVVISPHNDDEVLFTGYTLMRHRPQVIVVTDSFIQDERGDVGCDMETRRNESISACAFLGCPVSFLGIRDTELTERELKKRLKNIEADTIYIPAYHKDGNAQHNLINKVCLEVFPKEKIEQYCSYSRNDLMIKGNYEVKPTKEEMERKNKAMNFYVSQINLDSMASHFEFIRNKSEYLL